MTIHYLGVRFTENTNINLKTFRWKNSLSFLEMPSLGYHSTIAYSITPFEFCKLREIPKQPIGYVNKSGGLFGESFVLTYKSKWIEVYHNYCIDNGATWARPNFIPHITIAEHLKEIPHITQHMNFPIYVSEIFYREWDNDDPS